MTKEFHEGQEVEVWTDYSFPAWRLAKVIRRRDSEPFTGDYEIQFHTGSCGVFAAEHIRKAVNPDKDRIFEDAFRRGY